MLMSVEISWFTGRDNSILHNKQTNFELLALLFGVVGSDEEPLVHPLCKGEQQ